MDMILGNNGDRYTLEVGHVYMNGFRKRCPTNHDAACNLDCMHLNRSTDGTTILYMTCTGIKIGIRVKGAHEL